MKLIEEIKKAEEKGEILKKNALDEGQSLVEKAREKGEKDLAALDDFREKQLEKALDRAREIVDSEVAKIDAEHEKALKAINESYKKNKDKTIKKIQEIILKWPSSQ
jgi:vacuolar-type H+-ATPase subunit H